LISATGHYLLIISAKSSYDKRRRCHGLSTTRLRNTILDSKDLLQRLLSP